MTVRDSPAAEVDISPELVRSLLAAQHPDLAHLEITFLAQGWDNCQFRLGDRLIARLPRRKLAVRLIEHEQVWLPHLAPLLPLPIPAPVRLGSPSELFPWPWSIVPWLQGRDALRSAVLDTRATGEQLGQFFNALHRPAPADAPENLHRGIPLDHRAERDEAALVALTNQGVVPPMAIDVWRVALGSPPHDGPPLWLHGDPHAGNMIVQDGALVSIIDWGDITSGDPASDLIGFWMLLDEPGRQAGRAALDHGEDTWIRAKGWAVVFAGMLLTNSADRPDYYDLGLRTIEEVIRSPG
ncbi:MAG: aminoglycoside phosphotransferase family protein [Acidimicrobiales bacterium]